MAHLVEYAPNIEPSMTALAQELGTSRQQIIRIIDRCEALGLLSVRRNGHRKRNHYELTMTDPSLLTADPSDPSGKASEMAFGKASDDPQLVTLSDQTSYAQLPALVTVSYTKTLSKEDKKEVLGGEHPPNRQLEDLKSIYTDRFEAVRGEPPKIKDQERHFLMLLDKCDGSLDAATKVLDRVYAPGSRWRDKATIAMIAKDPDMYAARPAAKQVGWKRFPPSFTPDKSHRELAASYGLDLAYELEKILDHEFKNPQTDPAAVLRSWLRRQNGWDEKYS